VLVIHTYLAIGAYVLERAAGIEPSPRLKSSLLTKKCNTYRLINHQIQPLGQYNALYGCTGVVILVGTIEIWGGYMV
jgi:hypothetical protein